MKFVTRILLLALCSLALLLARETTLAAPDITFTVNSTLDQPDNNLLDGRCRTASGVCTLRAAIMQANVTKAPDKIKLAPAVYKLTREGAEDNAQRGDLDITSDMTISGALIGTTILDGKEISERVFTIFQDADVTLTRLTIRNGAGAIYNLGLLKLTNSTLRGNTTTIGGGGLLNGGTATVTSTTIHKNKAFQGGGIYNYGTLNVKNSTIDQNRAVGLPMGIQDPDGGGLFNFGTSHLFNTTVSANRADGSGGGIYNYGNFTRLDHVTVAYNRADQDRKNGGTGAGIKSEAGDIEVYNSIVANNYRPGLLAPLKISDDCHQSQQFQIIIIDSLIEDPRNCPIPVPASLKNVDPLLNPLANNGGLTKTHALQSNSPAIDLPSSCQGGNQATRDQRNYSRPIDGNGDGLNRCDAGSFEYGGKAP